VNQNADMLAESLDKMAEHLMTQYRTNLPDGARKDRAILAIQRAQSDARKALGATKPGGEPESTDH